MLSVILQLIASLTLLVVIHEFGHFIFARLFKIRVEKFRMFFDPWFTLFKFKPKNSDTEFGLGWLPIGGYVKIAGMIDESLDTDQMAKPAQPWEFRSHPAWQRLFVMLGGVLFNLLLAFVIYTGISYHYGDSYLPIDAVEEGMKFSDVAKKAGFVDGDILLKADDQKLIAFDEECFRTILKSEKVTVLRNGQEKTVAIPFDFMEQLMKENTGFATYRIPFVVDSLMKDSPAEKAGLQAKDRVIAVNNQPMCVSDITTTFHNNPNKPLTLTVVRGADNCKMTSLNDSVTVANPMAIAADTLQMRVTPNEMGMIGVMIKSAASLYEPKHVEYSLLESVPAAIHKVGKKLSNYTNDLKYVFTPEGISSVGGVGSIASLFPTDFSAYIFWEMTAFLSVILAVMNVLPIPGLDGGHVVFVLYEIITRRKPSQNFLIRAQMVGMFLLIFLMLYANLNDVFRFLLN